MESEEPQKKRKRTEDSLRETEAIGSNVKEDFYEHVSGDFEVLTPRSDYNEQFQLLVDQTRFSATLKGNYSTTTSSVYRTHRKVC